MTTGFAGEILLIRDIADAMRTPKIRPISEFAESEIVLPDGPYRGFRLRLNRSPAARLLYKEIDTGRWKRIFVTGPNQDGKSLFGFTVPTLYALFERRERVICGVPDLNMVGDKWRLNLLPAIKASRYASLLPTTGSGSRGGDSVLFEFGNGAELRFMTGGGDDQTRAGMGTPNLNVTETEGFDEVGGSSREGDKFSQLERRTLAEPNARIVAECTVSDETGRTWREIKAGSDSRIAIPCAHCKAFVTPEREHFFGWKDAETQQQACLESYVGCPNCGAAWTNEERIEANQHAVLVHKGQTVGVGGEICGPVPQTDTLGFRWNVVNCVLNSGRMATVGGLEWKALRAADEEAAERDLCQSQWAMPTKGKTQALNVFDYAVLMKRLLLGVGRGVCPPDRDLVTVGTDVGKWLLHWVAIAWKGGTPHSIDYGVQEVPSDIMAEELAIKTALRSLRDDTLKHGWSHNAGRIEPTLVFVDARYKSTPVHEFIAESPPGYFATMGFGILQRRSGKDKRESGWTVVKTGDKYSVLKHIDGRFMVEVNSDAWKSWLHARVTTPMGQIGAFTLFDPSIVVSGGTVKGNIASVEHLSYAKHMTAEREVEDWDPKEGTVTRWEAVSRKNHYLDATMLACVAGHAAGVRLEEPSKETPPPPPPVESEHSELNPLTGFRGKW